MEQIKRKSLLRDTRGEFVEKIIIVVVVAIAGIVAWTQFGGSVQNTVGSMGTSVSALGTQAGAAGRPGGGGGAGGGGGGIGGTIRGEAERRAGGIIRGAAGGGSPGGDNGSQP